MFRTLLACAIALPALAAADPPGRYSFRSYGSDQGLENLSINQVSQTRDGLLWVATEDGLYSYDGHRFERLDVTAGLPSNEILSVLPSARGLWVGTARGLAIVEHGRVQAFGPASGAPMDQIHALALAPDGRLWAATDVGLFHQAGDRFVLASGWRGASFAVWVGADGRVVAGQGRNVATADATAATSGRWTEHGSAEGFDRDRIEAIAETGDGLLWVRSAHHLWSCARDLTGCIERSSELPDVSEVGRLLVDRDGTLWVATRRGLAHRIDAGRWEVIGSEQGLHARSVINAFEDREGSLWFGADQLYQLLGRGLWRSYTSHNDLPADTVWTMMRDRAGALWVGSNHGVVEAFGDSWRTFPGTEPYNVETLVEAGDVLYAAGTDSRVMRLDRTTRTMTVIGPGPELEGNAIVSMVFDRGTLWLATYNAGLLAMTETAGRRTWARVTLPGGDGHEDVGQLVLDRGGRLWAATSVGLAVLDGGRWQRFTATDGLAATETAYLVERRSGEMCVTYTESFGITCFRYTHGRLAQLRQLTQATGLTNNKIYMLGEDRDGRLYAGMGIGVDVIAGTSIEHVSSASGLVGDDCAARAFWADPSGDVLIGTTRGLARFSAGSYTGPPAPIAPVVRSIALGGVVSTTGELPVARDTGTTSFVVRFAVPAFASGGGVERQVRLLPLEREWRTTQSDEARYAQLPHGSYTLELRARIIPGGFGPVTRVAVTIPPDWWQTTWFRALLAVGLLLVTGGVIAWGARRMTRRAAQRIVQRSEASFRALIEESPDAVFVVRDGIVVYVNAKTISALGYGGAPEILGRNVLVLLDPSEHAMAAERMARMVTTGEPAIPREVRMVRKDGSLIHAEISALQVEFAGTPALLAIARDCTERKALEARLMTADRMASIGTLAAGIAHEVNNPLAYVKSNLAAISDELAEAPRSESIRSALADAIDGATRVENIVRGLRTFSRLERDRRDPVKVERALELALRMTANDRRHRCKTIERYGAVPAVLGDEAKLGQVFINLLVNAAHAIPDGHADDHAITITTRTDGQGRAVIEIADTGCGMTPEIQKRVFEPFFTTKDIGQGTGLGLSICHGIVESLGGELAVESTPGAGSTFRVVLPGTSLRPATAPPEPALTENQPRSELRRLLVIDDDARLLASVGRMLGKHFDVTLASCGEDALAKLEQGQRYDVILSDLMMPGFTGMDLHERLASELPDQARRMLFMTGGAFTTEAQQFLARPSIPSIEKPFEIAELRRLVEQIAADPVPGALHPLRQRAT
ncbi:MAG: Sensor protein [Myxococcales bacterium]|nr:Sensor protein [Myxococcales bacterium]